MNSIRRTSPRTDMNKLAYLKQIADKLERIVNTLEQTQGKGDVQKLKDFAETIQ